MAKDKCIRWEIGRLLAVRRIHVWLGALRYVDLSHINEVYYSIEHTISSIGNTSIHR